MIHLKVRSFMKISFYSISFLADRSARLWDVETGQCLLKYLGHNGSGTCT